MTVMLSGQVPSAGDRLAKRDGAYKIVTNTFCQRNHELLSGAATLEPEHGLK